MEPPHINSSFESIPGATQRLCRAFVGAPEELCRRLEALYGDDPNKYAVVMQNIPPTGYDGVVRSLRIPTSTNARRIRPEEDSFSSQNGGASRMTGPSVASSVATPLGTQVYHGGPPAAAYRTEQNGPAAPVVRQIPAGREGVTIVTPHRVLSQQAAAASDYYSGGGAGAAPPGGQSLPYASYQGIQGQTAPQWTPNQQNQQPPMMQQQHPQQQQQQRMFSQNPYGAPMHPGAPPPHGGRPVVMTRRRMASSFSYYYYSYYDVTASTSSSSRSRGRGRGRSDKRKPRGGKKTKRARSRQRRRRSRSAASSASSSGSDDAKSAVSSAASSASSASSSSESSKPARRRRRVKKDRK